ncbi:MAG: hypothetical protein GWP91_20065 [Rhodobacterales bacterium]|nr:hypothetical protein [Rhodobacterales bacterium]
MNLARSLWALARPPMIPMVLGLPIAGFGWGHWDRALSFRGGSELVWVLLAWALLHAGTLWLNASVDQDEGEVLFGQKVERPRHLAAWGYAALGFAMVACVPAGSSALVALVVCVLLAVVYSHPSFAWKGHPILGPGVNLVGYGLLSTYAGWSVVGGSPNPRTVIIWGVGALTILAVMFAAQVFQEQEDRDRGYRTLVVTHGPRTTLMVSSWAFMFAWCAAMGLAVAGWLPRAILLVAPGWLWVDQWLRVWAKKPNGGTESDAREWVRRVAVVLMIGFTVVFGEYLRQSLTGMPVAGLGTTAGLPLDF